MWKIALRRQHFPKYLLIDKLVFLFRYESHLDLVLVLDFLLDLLQGLFHSGKLYSLTQSALFSNLLIVQSLLIRFLLSLLFDCPGFYEFLPKFRVKDFMITISIVNTLKYRNNTLNNMLQRKLTSLESSSSNVLILSLSSVLDVVNCLTLPSASSSSKSSKSWRLSAPVSRSNFNLVSFRSSESWKFSFSEVC